MAAPTHVVFLCPGTTDKPPHPCTREALAALDYALTAPPDLTVFTGLEDAVPSKTPQLVPTPYQPILDKLGETLLRVQVKCQYCASVSILTHARIKEPRWEEAEGGFWSIDLLPPTPSDEALADAAKGISGIEALKNSTANAVFVTGNLTLLTTLVTVLGLSKTEEIGSKLTESGAGVLLVLAVFLGAGAIFWAVWAMLAHVRAVRLGNLEDVRAALNKEVSDRVQKSRYSLFFFMGAVGTITVAFLWITVVKVVKDDEGPAGSLTVSISPATLDVSVESSWSGADDDATLEVSADGAAILSATDEVTDGSAKVERSVRAIRPTEGSSQLTVIGKLVDAKGSDVPGALKQACFDIPATGTPRARDC